MNESIRSLFPVTRKYTYLNHSTVSPLSARARDAMTGLITDVAENGAVNYFSWLDVYERVRAAGARLVNASPREIAFMRNTSDAIATVANGIDWRAGDNIVTCDVEFPANVYPWMKVSADHRVEIRKAKERDGRIDLDELLSLVDKRTRVLTLSWVQFASGFRSNIEEIGRFCRERGVIFFIDAIQGLGGLKLDVQKCCVDAFAADSHKYLLGPEGVALLYVSGNLVESIRPSVVGWMSVTNPDDYLDYRMEYRDGALRYECGTLNTAGVYGLGGAIDLFLEVGPERIEEHLLDLASRLTDGLKEKGYTVAGSARSEERSQIVTCSHERYSAIELYELLDSQRIVTAARVGRLRISPHFYNTREEINRLIEALP